MRQLAKLGVPEIEVSFSWLASREAITNLPTPFGSSVAEGLIYTVPIFLVPNCGGKHHMPPH